MKKLFVLAILIVSASIVTSCGSREAHTNTWPKDTSLSETENVVEKTPATQEFTAASVYIGQITKSDESHTEEFSESGPYRQQLLSFDIVITPSDSIGQKTLTVSTEDSWSLEKTTKETDPGKTEKLQKFYAELKNLKAKDFTVVMTGDKIEQVYIKPVFKEGKDGQVGELVSSKRTVWPYTE
jgi:hypothetical protein